MKSPTPEEQCTVGVFQIQYPICSVNFATPPLHDLTISPHVKYSPINLPKKVCSPMQSFFTKKVPPYFVRGEETLCFIFISFPVCKGFIPNLCGTNYDLSSKTTEPLFLKSCSMVLKFSKLFQPELQNHVAKNIKLGDKIVTNL